MDFHHSFLNACNEAIHFDNVRRAILSCALMSKWNGDLVIFYFTHAQVNADWDTSKFPVIEFESRVVVFTVVDVHTDTTSMKNLFDLLGAF